MKGREGKREARKSEKDEHEEILLQSWRYKEWIHLMSKEKNYDSRF